MKHKQDSDIAAVIGIGGHKPAKSKRKIILSALVIIGLAAIILFTVSARGKSRPMEFKTDAAQEGDITVLVTVTGNLEPTNQVDVGSEVSGTIATVEVDFNDQVTVGQVLAKIDTTKIMAQVTQSKAALESARATVLQAEATLNETSRKLAQYEKVRELSEGKVPSQTDFDAQQAAVERAKADLASAKAAVSKAEATLEANETDLSKAVIRSPINGVVLTRAIEPGQTVAASFTTPVMFTLAEDLAEMELHVNVDEADIGKVQEGQDALFTVDAYPDRAFEAKIVQIRYGSETLEGVVTYETVLSVDNKDLTLRPGMTATADIIVLKVEETLTIPNAALRFKMPEGDEATKGGGLVNALLPRRRHGPVEQKQAPVRPNTKHEVWILNDSEPKKVTVTVGQTDGIITEVLDGPIKAGTQVITDVMTGAQE